MGTILPPRRQGQLARMWVIIGLALLVMGGIIFQQLNSWDSMDPWEEAQITSGKPKHEEFTNDDTISSNKKSMNGSPAKHNKQQSFWENAIAPDPRQQQQQQPQQSSYNKFSLFQWKKKKSNPTIQKKNKKEKGAKKTKKTTNNEIIDSQQTPFFYAMDTTTSRHINSNDDDRVPQAAAGAVIRAADALLCRESVIDYVINATDLKDECDGLKKAYTKNCGGDDDDGDEEEARIEGDKNRRALKNQEKSLKRNPLLEWHQWLHRKLQIIRRYWCPKPFLIEDEIIEEWNAAMYEVEHDWDTQNYKSYSVDRRLKVDQRGNFVHADESLDKHEQKPPLEIAPVLPKTTNKTKTVSKDKPKMSNLALPTTKQHVSEKMLSETLMLQQQDRLASDAKPVVSNSVTETLSDAAKSSKALSDAEDYVSSVLTDPSSIEARTCCTSILNVFHEECNVDSEDDISDTRLFIVVVVIALCGMVKSLIRHFQIRWLPEAAGCILVGVISGWALSYFPHHDISFDGKWFLRILVPPIVFEAALSIDKRSFNKHIVPILLYSILGTLLSTGLTALFLHKGTSYYHGFCETIPVVEALAFGSLISSIDPIAVLSMLSNMGMTDTDTIYVVIFGESLLNDGVAIVFYQTIVHFLDANMEVDGAAITAAAIHFIVVAIGSLLIGLMSGICCTIYYWAFHGCQTPLVEVLMFCCWALLPYYVCDGMEWSGIVAVVAAGFVMDIQVVGQKLSASDHAKHIESKENTPNNGHRRERRQQQRLIFSSSEGHLSKEAKIHIGFVTEIIATMMETAIFAYLGLFLFSTRYHWNNYHTMVAIGACCASRALMIPFLSALANSITKIQRVRVDSRYQQLPQHEQASTSGKPDYPAGVIIDPKMQVVLWFAGLRGAMSFALVEDIPTFDAVTHEGTRFKSELKAMTSACIIFTVFVLGGLTYYMMDYLGMAPSNHHERRLSKGKEMELISLMSNSFSTRGDNENELEDKEPTQSFAHDEGHIPSAKSPAPVSGGNRFRQRLQAS